MQKVLSIDHVLLRVATIIIFYVRKHRKHIYELSEPVKFGINTMGVNGT